MKPRRVFLTYDDIAVSVFESQIRTPLLRLQALGLRHDFVGFRTVGALLTGRSRERIEALHRELDGDVMVFTTLPWFGRFDLRYPTVCVGRALRRLGIGRGDGLIVHARGHYAGFAALSLKRAYPNLRLIANLRGVPGPEAALYRLPSWPRCRLDWRLIGRALVERFNRWERGLAREADVVVCVSKAFRNYLREQYALPDDRVEVVTTAVDTDLFRFDPSIRDETRRRLGVESKLVLAFCGSTHKWELPDSALSLLCDLLARDADLHLLAITTQPGETRRALSRTGVPHESVTVTSVPHEQVPELLMAADVGLLIREDNIVNRVAAPTKFGEYLACGLPVLVSEGVGDTAEIVSSREAGWVVGAVEGRLGPQDIAEILKNDWRRIMSDEFKRHCAEVGRELYSWDTQMRSLLQVYERAEQTGQGRTCAQTGSLEGLTPP